jgi:hypothetical protein
MKIKYHLVKCYITNDPNNRRAQVVGYEVVTEKEIFEHITRTGGAITLAEAKANYEEIIGTLEYFLKLGYGIKTEFLLIHPVIQGLFHGDEDNFEQGRNKIKFRSQLGKRYNRTADDVKVEKVEAPSRFPVVVSVEDIVSATINNTLTPDGVVSLTGSRLRFKQDDPQQGIFLINTKKEEYRIERILSHTGTHIIFQLPSGLVSDEYTLEVRVRLNGNKTMKKGTLTERLTI